MTNVGIISLDLVIKENITNQLNKIKSNVQNAFSKPIEQASDTVKQSVDKTFESADKTVKAFKNNVVLSGEELKKATKETMAASQGAFDECFAEMHKQYEQRNKYAEQNPIEIDYTPKLDKGRLEEIKRKMDEIDAQAVNPLEYIEKSVNGTLDEAGKKIKEALNFEVEDEPVKRMEQSLDNLRTKFSLLQKDWQELNDSSSNAKTEEEVSKISSKMNGIERQLISIKDQEDKLNSKIAETVDKTKTTKEEVVSATSEMAKGFKVARSSVGRIKQEIELNANEMNRWQETIKQLQAELEKCDDAFETEQLSSKIDQAKSKLLSLANKDASLNKKLRTESTRTFSQIKNVILKIATPIKKVASLVKKTLGGAFKGLKSVAGKALDGIKDKFSKLHNSVGGLEKPVKKLGHSIKNAFRRVFVMAGVLALVKALRSAITGACNDNDEFAKSLNGIKANLAIAFEPIKNTIMPYINALMQGLVKVTQTVAAFTNALFGSTYQKSLNTLKKAQKANKEAVKEAKKNSTYLNSYDEMNVAQDTTNSDSGSSSSSEDSGIDYSAINGDNVKLTDWAERMKDAIKKGDWKGVGSLLAEKVNSAVDGIDWDKVKAKVNGFMKGVADGLNGFIKKINWKKLGKAFGEGINTIFGGLYTFMKTFDWSAFGKGIADFLNNSISTVDWSLVGRTLASKWTALIDTLYAFVTNFDFSGFGSSIGESVNAWFDEIDWAKLGETISESIKGLFDTLMGFLETVDWQGIGEKIWTLVKSIDWSGIAEKLFKTIGEAIGAAVSLIWGFIKEAVYKIRDYFKGKMEECGGSVIKGLLKGLWDGIKGIGTWIKDHIFKPFVDGFKKVFKIHSPSRIMAEMGDYIIQGLRDGVAAGIGKIKEIFGKILSKIKEVFAGIGKWFKEIFSGAWDNIKGCFSKIGEFFSKVWDKIKKPFESAGTWFYNIFKGVVKSIKNCFNRIWDVVKRPINWIIDGINTLIGGLNKINFDIPDWVPVIGGGSFGFNIPEIPKLATGGLATAPTLAMVGDNRNAKVDPEVISPLSKLQGMLDNGKLDEVAQLLREILMYLKTIDFTFLGTVDGRKLFEFVREMNNEYKRRTGVSAF